MCTKLSFPPVFQEMNDKYAELVAQDDVREVGCYVPVGCYDPPDTPLCCIRTMYERSSATYLWAAMTHLTPSALDILISPGGGIRDQNTKIAR